jgi:catecholate siderophore receptor
MRIVPMAAMAALLALAPLSSGAQPATTLPEVKVREKADDERADGPVEGYRATRSSTFTRTDTPLKEVPASVAVVPSQVVKDASLLSLGELFHYVPGAVAHQGEGNRDQVVLRGTSTTADFYLNGVRDDAQVFRDLYNIERVEVLKGPAGMAFGRGGAGGVVNRVTRKPVFAHVGEASFTAGLWGQARATVDAGEKAGDSAAWRTAAMAERAGSFRDGVELKRWAVNPSATVLLGSGTLVTLDFEHQDDRRTADRGIPSRDGRPFEAPPGRFFGNAAQSEARSRYSSFAAALEHELSDRWQLRNTLRATRYYKRYQNVYPGSAVNDAGNLSLAAYNNRNERDNVFDQADLVGKLDWGGMRHTVLAGVELGRQESANARNTGFFGVAGTATTALVSASDPFAVATRFAANGGDADNNVTASVAAAYLQDQVELSPRWRALAGVRVDRFKVDFDDRRTLVAATDLSRTDTVASPRAGIVFLPADAWTLYAGYGFAFLPSGEQLGLATTTADLGPEKSVNQEIGARWDVMPRLTLSAALFRTERRDVRVADPFNPGLFVKSGEQRAQGLELGLQGDVTRRWQIYGGFTHLVARVMTPVSTGTTASVASVIPAGNRLPLTPGNAFSLWNRFDVGGGWGAGLGVIRQGASFASIANTVRLPAFTRVDGAIFYAFDGGRMRVALNVENLGDRRYYPTVDGDNNLSPGAPRNARITVTHLF